VSKVSANSVRYEISLRKARDWKGLSQSSNDSYFEAKIPSNFVEPPQAADTWQAWLEVLKPDESAPEPKSCWNPAYYLLIANSPNQEDGKVYVCREKDLASNVATIHVGDWSDWIYEEVSTVNGRNRTGFRFRLNELSSDGRRFELYRTALHKTTGWTDPSCLAEEITEKIGPYASGHEGYPISPDSPKYNKIYFEHVSQFANYLADVARYLKERSGWKILITQIHVQDEFCHEVGFEGIDITSPYHNPGRSEIDWKIMREQYRVCDEWIGRLIRECADENTLIAVISDHAAIPTRKTIAINEVLAKEGLLVSKKDKKSGLLAVDWSKTKAYNRPGFPIGYIWVNLKGRDPEGIVASDKEYKAVCNRVVSALYSLRDPETGECPIALALNKDDAALLGQWGERAPDVFYSFRAGYNRKQSNMIPRGVKLGQQEKTMLVSQQAGRGTHGGYLPTASLGPCTNKAFLILAGPGVKRGYRRSRAIWLTDVTPTISYLLGISPPSQSEGSVIWDILA